MFDFSAAIKELNDGKKVAPWLASQADILAEDWYVVFDV